MVWRARAVGKPSKAVMLDQACKHTILSFWHRSWWPPIFGEWLNVENCTVTSSLDQTYIHRVSVRISSMTSFCLTEIQNLAQINPRRRFYSWWTLCYWRALLSILCGGIPWTALMCLGFCTFANYIVFGCVGFSARSHSFSCWPLMLLIYIMDMSWTMHMPPKIVSNCLVLQITTPPKSELFGHTYTYRLSKLPQRQILISKTIDKLSCPAHIQYLAS